MSMSDNGDAAAAQLTAATGSPVTMPNIKIPRIEFEDDGYDDEESDDEDQAVAAAAAAAAAAPTRQSWSDEETDAFIEIVQEYVQPNSKHTISMALWDSMTQAMHSRGHKRLSATQLRNKYSNMVHSGYIEDVRYQQVKSQQDHSKTIQMRAAAARVFEDSSSEGEEEGENDAPPSRVKTKHLHHRWTQAEKEAFLQSIDKHVEQYSSNNIAVPTSAWEIVRQEMVKRGHTGFTTGQLYGRYSYLRKQNILDKKRPRELDESSSSDDESDEGEWDQPYSSRTNPWTQEETDTLAAAVKTVQDRQKQGEAVDTGAFWDTVAKELGNARPTLAYRLKYYNPNILKKKKNSAANPPAAKRFAAAEQSAASSASTSSAPTVLAQGMFWTMEDTQKLFKLVQQKSANGTSKDELWESVAKELPGRTASACITKYRKTKRLGVGPAASTATRLSKKRSREEVLSSSDGEEQSAATEQTYAKRVAADRTASVASEVDISSSSKQSKRTVVHWSKDDVERLLTLVDNKRSIGLVGSALWRSVAEEFGSGRTASSCADKYKRWNRKIRNQYEESSDEKDDSEQEAEPIAAAAVPAHAAPVATSGVRTRGRWLQWTTEESQRLLNIVQNQHATGLEGQALWQDVDYFSTNDSFEAPSDISAFVASSQPARQGDAGLAAAAAPKGQATVVSSSPSIKIRTRIIDKQQRIYDNASASDAVFELRISQETTLAQLLQSVKRKYSVVDAQIGQRLASINYFYYIYDGHVTICADDDDWRAALDCWLKRQQSSPLAAASADSTASKQKNLCEITFRLE